jgi:acyl-CoA reductase-like NAD-dependent aldehyde dehydrogenase
MQGLDPDLRALQEVRDACERAARAQQAVARWTQQQIDRACEGVVAACVRAAHALARAAVEETGIGRVHYKVLKNLFGAEGTWPLSRTRRRSASCGATSTRACSRWPRRPA